MNSRMQYWAMKACCPAVSILQLMLLKMLWELNRRLYTRAMQMSWAFACFREETGIMLKEQAPKDP